MAELIGLGLLEKQDDKSGRYRYRLATYKVTSEEVKQMRYPHEVDTGETMDASEQRLQKEVEALKERIETSIGPQGDDELEEQPTVCQGIEQVFACSSRLSCKF